MKVQATYRHVFNVKREVEVDEPEFLQWAQDRYGDEYVTELAIAAWLDDQDTEFGAEVFRDWKINMPLPADFELQYSEVEDVVIEQGIEQRSAAYRVGEGENDADS